MDPQTQAILIQCADEFAGSASDFLGQKLGRVPTDPELITFRGILAGMSNAWCYGKFYQSDGQGPADAWLRGALSSIGMGVKKQGIPITLQITLKSILEEGAAVSPIVQEKPPIVICKCVTDATGQCAACVEELDNAFSQFIGLASSMEDIQSKERCQPCIQKVLDPVFAKIIESKFGEMSDTTRGMLSMLAVQVAAVYGVLATPQSDAALGARNKS